MLKISINEINDIKEMSDYLHIQVLYFACVWALKSVSDDTLLLRGRGCYDHMRDRDCLGIY